MTRDATDTHDLGALGVQCSVHRDTARDQIELIDARRVEALALDFDAAFRGVDIRDVAQVSRTSPCRLSAWFAAR